MTAAELKRIRELCDKAIKGPWDVARDPDNDDRPYQVVAEIGTVIVCRGPWECMEFIAAARTALPESLDELERLKQLPEDCETCAGDGMMEVVTGHTPDDGELYAMEICAECHGTGDGHIADAHNKLRAEVKRLRGELHAATIAEPDSEAYREAVRNWREVNDQLDTTGAAIERLDLRVRRLTEHQKAGDKAAAELEAERDEARAEVGRFRKRIQQERVEHQIARNGMTEYRAALVDIVAKIGGRVDSEGPLEDESAQFAITRALKALSE